MYVAATTIVASLTDNKLSATAVRVHVEGDATVVTVFCQGGFSWSLSYDDATDAVTVARAVRNAFGLRTVVTTPYVGKLSPAITVRGADRRSILS